MIMTDYSKKYLSPAYENLSEISEKFKNNYANNAPFPNIYFNDFFSEEFLNKVLDEFPDLSKQQSEKMVSVNEFKFAGVADNFFGEHTREFMNFLNSKLFLEFLQNLTGIDETLVGDPYYFGAGQHEIKRGGFLKVHADFNTHKLFKLDRRLNVLVYLNKDWKIEYGGDFELWNLEMTKCVKKIQPIFNTLAVFSTTDFSYHGHPDKLNCPENMSRKSLALYYYSNGRPNSEKNFLKNSFQKDGTLFKVRSGSDEELKGNNRKLEFKILLKKVLPRFFWKKDN
jgi:Rps23 Pro-64 3,4-dihydroxylase Tpa1-like proline 4-hydroxylase